MHARKAGEHYILRLDTNEELISTLKVWAAGEGVKAAAFWGIGALSRARLGYFDPQTMSYKEIPIEEQMEVVAINGNMSLGEEGEPVIHVHVVLSNSDGQAIGGHLFEGFIRPTLELILIPLPTELRRLHDPTTGLKILDL